MLKGISSRVITGGAKWGRSFIPIKPGFVYEWLQRFPLLRLAINADDEACGVMQAYGFP
jgi:hypothetical protein